MGVYTMTDVAEVDLVEAGVYIARDNPSAADRFVDQLEHVCQMLADNPSAGRRRDELGLGLRSFPCGSFVVFYRQRKNEILVVRVVHGARNLTSLF
ncbi:MAG: type II toxin-antitoxin system RelE/ParE family toxin [Phycisphaerae bacterium]|nr:type II toxin-antitoxin system RelE/ParE family toxin [Phycisphaerae bacterium]